MYNNMNHVDESDSESEENYWSGYRFKNCYDDSLTKNEEQLNSLFLNYQGNELIVVSHEIYFNLEKCNANEYPYDKKLYYYIKVPKKGLTYNELFKQIDEQSKNYKDDLYHEDHKFIEEIRKQTDVEYYLECGS